MEYTRHTLSLNKREFAVHPVVLLDRLVSRALAKHQLEVIGPYSTGDHQEFIDKTKQFRQNSLEQVKEILMNEVNLESFVQVLNTDQVRTQSTDALEAFRRCFKPSSTMQETVGADYELEFCFPNLSL